jgi:hypothetical protein
VLVVARHNCPRTHHTRHAVTQGWLVCAHDSTAPADCTHPLSSTSSRSPRRCSGPLAVLPPGAGGGEHSGEAAAGGSGGRRQRQRTAGIRAGGGDAHPVLRRLHASTNTDYGAHTRRTGVPAFARMATQDAVVVPVQLDVVLVQVGVQVVGTCPHSTHTAHAIQATCVKQFQMQATDASLNLTYPSHAVARGSSGGFACGGAILEKCCPKRGT